MARYNDHVTPHRGRRPRDPRDPRRPAARQGGAAADAISDRAPPRLRVCHPGRADPRDRRAPAAADSRPLTEMVGGAHQPRRSPVPDTATARKLT